MSIVRIGLSETKHFAQGYEAIFGKKKGKGKSAPRGKGKAAKSKSKTRKK